MKHKPNLAGALSGQAPCARCEAGVMYLERKISDLHIILKCNNCSIRDEIIYDKKNNKLMLVM